MRPIVVIRVVSIDYPQKQVHTFRCEFREVRVFLRGGGTPPPHGHTLPLPPLGSLHPCNIPHRPPIPLLTLSLPRSSWPCGGPVAGLDFCGGGDFCLVPLFHTLLILLPPSPLPMLPLPLATWVCRACCLRGSGSWPLNGPPPGGELTILFTILRA